MLILSEGDSHQETQSEPPRAQAQVTPPEQTVRTCLKTSSDISADI